MLETKQKTRISHRREKKIKKTSEKFIKVEKELTLKEILPKTKNQQILFNEFKNRQALLLHGYAGTGKTYISLFLGLKQLNDELYDKILILRSTVPSRDIGFLPGKKEDKIKDYETPYDNILSELYNEKIAYSKLKLKNKIEFIPTSFIRGLTFDRSIIIVDEIQNMEYHELSTIMTRIGKDSKIIFIGDFRQSDLKYNDQKRGIHKFMKIIKNMKSFYSVEMGIDDIIRSKLVKDFIIEESKYSDSSLTVLNEIVVNQNGVSNVNGVHDVSTLDLNLKSNISYGF